MSPEVFDQALRRTVEYRDITHRLFGAEVVVSLCGLGEPLLNRHAATFARATADAGFRVRMSSNGALLTEQRGAELLDAGIGSLLINVGEEGDEYERVYKLPWATTRDNVIRFAEMARGRCEVYVVLVDHRRNREHLDSMRAMWRSHGIELFVEYEIMNRGGALFVDHMQFESYPEIDKARAMLASRGATPLCAAPFAYLFVGYDGQYYLCCSDWRKETPLGSVFDESFQSVTGRKLALVAGREPVCKTCNLDPLNKLTEELRAHGGHDSDGAALVDAIADGTASVEAVVGPLGFDVPAPPARARRLIPVQAR